MSNRKPASKRTRGPKLAARAQRTKQAVVKSPKQKLLRSVAHNVVSVPAASTESVAAASTQTQPNLHDASKQETPHVENPADGLQDEVSHVMTNTDSKKAIDHFSSSTAGVKAYQAMFMEMAQANIQFPFEFAQRLASIRSPFEFLTVIAEIHKQATGHGPEVFERDG